MLGSRIFWIHGASNGTAASKLLSMLGRHRFPGHSGLGAPRRDSKKLEPEAGARARTQASPLFGVLSYHDPKLGRAGEPLETRARCPWAAAGTDRRDTRPARPPLFRDSIAPRSGSRLKLAGIRELAMLCGAAGATPRPQKLS